MDKIAKINYIKDVLTELEEEIEQEINTKKEDSEVFDPSTVRVLEGMIEDYRELFPNYDSLGTGCKICHIALGIMTGVSVALGVTILFLI